MTADDKQHAATSVQALLGHKLGMTQVWDASDRLMPLTVMQVGTDIVIQIRAEKVDGYSAVQLGFGETPVRKVTEPMAGHSAKVGIEPCHHLTEVRTSAAGSYELDQEPQATVFEAGQAVDVSGNTKGKGSAGAMKHHGFVGVSTSRGAHHSHHKPGSIDACTTPGRISKGLRMAGRVRNVRHTVQNLRIQAVDAERDLLLISGAISGPRNDVVLVRSSMKNA